MFGFFKNLSFKGGVHPPHNKSATESSPITLLPPPPKVYIPLSMHIGAPAKIAVKRGDQVKIGQLLADAGGFVSAPVHSSVSGKVASIADYPHPLGKHVTAVEIENDGLDEQVEFQPFEKSWREAAPGELVQKIASSGLVGMGGASFPTHVKLTPPSDKPIDTLIINGAECEPFLTADHRMLLEKSEQILKGALIIKKILGARKAFIAIEDNKPDALKIIGDRLREKAYDSLTLAKLKTKYPQGGEKQLISAVTSREVPSGGLPMDVGCVVQNVGTAYAVWNAIINGIPLYQRVVTVTGPTAGKPANLMVRIGTPIEYVLEQCDVNMGATKKVIMGGPMMGLAQSELSAPVIKSTSGLLCYDTVYPGIRGNPCISCGNCVKACPVHLVPSMLAKYIDKEAYEDAEQWNVLDCMECGSCAFVCPSKINLVHFMKLGKNHVMAARKAAAKKK
ncbi:MAG: electron transport complex subunit RsxC [Chitinivibrionales bacterium]